MAELEEEIDFSDFKPVVHPDINGEVSNVSSSLISEDDFEEVDTKTKYIYIGVIVLMVIGVFMLLRYFYFVPKPNFNTKPPEIVLPVNVVPPEGAPGAESGIKK